MNFSLRRCCADNTSSSLVRPIAAFIYSCHYKPITRSCRAMSSDPNEPVLVHTKSGPVRGLRNTTIDRLDYISFQGIPYAQPPIGELRFKKPQPVTPWTATIDAFRLPADAPALTADMHDFDHTTSENCLFLNIFTRSIAADAAQRPVMIFIHGGGFMRGSISSAKYGADFLLRQNVVLVTIAYRLGALGFLSVADPRAEGPGNAGLKDQTLGIRWVRENIAAFGGDPRNMTLVGESAGSVSVHMHMLSDHSKNLFQRAILQSGTSLCPWALQPARDLAAALAQRLGWDGQGGVDGMMCILKTADIADIARNEWLQTAEETKRGIGFVFVPVVEPYGGDDPSTCFLPKVPAEMMASAWGNTIPMIIGCNSDEGFLSYRYFEQKKSIIDEETLLSSTIPPTILATMSEAQRQRHVIALRALYFGDEETSMENVQRLVQLNGDAQFWYPTVCAIRGRPNGAAASYLYRFCFDSKEAMFGGVKMAQCGKLVQGSLHAEELMYIFRKAHIDYEALPDESEERRVTDVFVHLWTSFAEDGAPCCDNLIWDPVSVKAADLNAIELRGLSISSTVEMVDLPENDRLTLWSSIYKY